MSWGMQKNKETYKKPWKHAYMCPGGVKWVVGSRMHGGGQNTWWGCKGDWELNLAKTRRRS